MGLKSKLLSNICERTPVQIVEHLQVLGFSQITSSHIHTSSLAAVQSITNEVKSYTDLLIPLPVRSLFPAAQLNRITPNYIIVGGLSQGVDGAVINQTFRHLDAGAKLLAMHKNPYSLTPEGPSLDSGAYIAALEYAAGVEAIICGKPSPTFFASALASLGTSSENSLIVGDAPSTDMAGGPRRRPGHLTGTHRQGRNLRANTQPAQYNIASVAALLNNLLAERCNHHYRFNLQAALNKVH